MVIGLGGHVRVGYEDNPYLFPGELAGSNAPLVDKIVRIAAEQGREIASAAEARAIIGLPPRSKT
jgi:3-keto-5-aminohexanoate cleavage enzyme